MQLTSIIVTVCCGVGVVWGYPPYANNIYMQMALGRSKVGAICTCFVCYMYMYVRTYMYFFWNFHQLLLQSEKCLCAVVLTPTAMQARDAIVIEKVMTSF